LFNQALAQRLNEGLLNTVLSGDVMEVVASGGKFIAEDVDREQSRLNAGEISITGPMFGVKMIAPSGVPAEREAKLLHDSGLRIEDFGQYAQLLSGTRRPYIIRPADLVITVAESGIRAEFTLPAGTYATVLLRELMKPPEEPERQD
jgi:tRNA pseudouridine13 synthase